MCSDECDLFVAVGLCGLCDDDDDDDEDDVDVDVDVDVDEEENYKEMD